MVVDMTTPWAMRRVSAGLRSLEDSLAGLGGVRVRAREEGRRREEPFKPGILASESRGSIREAELQ